MTVDDLKSKVPKHIRGMIGQNVVDVFNELESDEGREFAEHYKQNFISMSSVMKTGQYSVSDYIDAVKFVAHKLLENSDIDAYQMTFPDRYQRLLDKYADYGTEDEIRGSKISSFVTAYKKGDLVTKVLEQSLVPSRILNAPMFQEALNIQMSIAQNSRSDQVRSQAAESVMKYTMSPEATKIELDVAVKGNDEILALRSTMHELASRQQINIKSGTNTSLDIAEQKLMYEVEDAIDVEAE
jgi:hypothetical protein